MTKPTLSRRAFLASSVAVAGTAGLMPAWPTPAHAQMGKVLRLRLDGDPDVLDPGYMSGGIEIEAQKQCLPFLADYHRDGDTITWKKTPFANRLEQRDPTHIDFELAEGLEWSDGYGPVTAADVKYSYERMKGTDWSGYFEALDHVEVTGDRTGTIVLNKPFSPFIMVTLCHGPGAILSEKAMKDVGEKFTTEFPAVCGPYTYSATPGQRVVYDLNPQWSGPKPGFERVECNVITQVKAAELAFEAGELDCTELGADTLARYTAEMPEGAEITTAGELQYMWLGMNTDHPKLKDKTVRRAIQHAVDVDAILQGAYSGTTTKSNGIICPGLIGRREDTKHYRYDPAKAR
jgi:peptide/nickel transport system substrate-binding protein